MKDSTKQMMDDTKLWYTTLVVQGVLSRTKTIIHVINGWFMALLMLLMVATLVYGCFNVVNAGKTPNVVLMLA